MRSSIFLHIILNVVSYALIDGNSWYVSPSGKDNVLCANAKNSFINPFFSLSAAHSCASSNDVIYMLSGDYVYTSIFQITKSITITSLDNNNVATIKLADLREPFLAIGQVIGNNVINTLNVTISNVIVNGFNVINQNIPCSGFILNYPFAALAYVTLENIIFNNWDAYDNYDTFQTNVIAGLYKSIIVRGCTFATSSSFYSPNSHIYASSTDNLIIENNQFQQKTIVASILDPIEKLSGGQVTISNNIFSSTGSGILLIRSSTMTWLVKDSLFDGNNIAGISCSFDKLVSKSSVVTLTIENVQFTNRNLELVYATNGCNVLVNKSQVYQCIDYSLFSCSDSTLSIEYTEFYSISTTKVVQCSNCQFTSKSNILDSNSTQLISDNNCSL